MYVSTKNFWASELPKCCFWIRCSQNYALLSTEYGSQNIGTFGWIDKISDIVKYFYCKYLRFSPLVKFLDLLAEYSVFKDKEKGSPIAKPMVLPSFAQIPDLRKIFEWILHLNIAYIPSYAEELPNNTPNKLTKNLMNINEFQIKLKLNKLIEFSLFILISIPVFFQLKKCPGMVAPH